MPTLPEHAFRPARATHLTLVGLAAGWALAWGAPAAAQDPELVAPRPLLAVVGLLPGPGVAAEDLEGVGDLLQSELLSLGVYEVIPRQEADSRLGEGSLEAFRRCGEDTVCLVAEGRRRGISRLLGGKVSRVGGSVVLSLTLVDVSSGTVLTRLGRRYRTEGSLEPLLDQVAHLAYTLAEADPEVAGALPPPPPPPEAPEAGAELGDAGAPPPPAANAADAEGRRAEPGRWEAPPPEETEPDEAATAARTWSGEAGGPDASGQAPPPPPPGTYPRA
ncbi:MAG: hypothetical protein D6729_13750, partial [Deltaproteobacteria bacterium]